MNYGSLRIQEEDWNEEDSDDEKSDEEEWKLGFVDDPNYALLQPKYFPSKVGGLPIWFVTNCPRFLLKSWLVLWILRFVFAQVDTIQSSNC